MSRARRVRAGRSEHRRLSSGDSMPEHSGTDSIRSLPPGSGRSRGLSTRSGRAGVLSAALFVAFLLLGTYLFVRNERNR